MLGLRASTDQAPEAVPCVGIVKNNRVVSSQKARRKTILISPF